MAYIGKSPTGTGVRSRFYYTQTSGGGTSISGTDDNSKTLTFTDGEYIDVFLNGVLLVAGTDYNTNTANTISGLAALANGDVVEVVVYDIFTVADTVSASQGGTFNAAITANQVNADNIRIDANTISSTDTNGDITLNPNGTGDTIVASGNVGINETSPDTMLHLKDTTANDGPVIRIEGSGQNAADQLIGGIEWKNTDTSGDGPNVTSAIRNYSANSSGSGGYLTFNTHDGAESGEGSDAIERMRLDKNGNLLVGKTSTDISVAGSRIGSFGAIFTRGDGSEPLRVNRTSTDGEIIRIDKDGSQIGTIGNTGSTLKINGNSSGVFLGGTAASMWPQTDNTHDLGTTGNRFDDIRATNATIQTSDQNEKQQIASLTTAEITAAKAISKLFKTFKWNDKVEAKGDAARTHAGVIAQEVQTAMTDAGLDATNYAFWCSDTWWETSTEVPAVEADEEAGIEARDAYTRVDTYDTADEAPEGATERTRLGIRYPELLAFIGAATEQRLADIETRLTALEAAE